MQDKVCKGGIQIKTGEEESNEERDRARKSLGRSEREREREKKSSLEKKGKESKSTETNEEGEGARVEEEAIWRETDGGMEKREEVISAQERQRTGSGHKSGEHCTGTVPTDVP